MPDTLQQRLATYGQATEADRMDIIWVVSKWERSLTLGEQSMLRAEVSATVMTTAGFEVGQAWEQLMPDGLAKGVASLTAMFELYAADQRRPLREVIWMTPVQEFQKATLLIRDRLIQGGEQESGRRRAGTQ